MTRKALSSPALRLIWAFGFLLLIHALVEACHAPWRDEYQAWLLGGGASTPVDVFKRLAHEGHPMVWYLPLMVLGWFTSSIVAMQVLGTVLASASGALVLVKAPFALWQRASFVFGYFAFFEYGTVIRGYTLGLLWLVILFIELSRHEPRYKVVLPFLGLCAWTSVHTGVVAFSIATCWMWPQFRAETRRRQTAILGALAAIVGLYLLQISRSIGLAHASASPTDVARIVTLGLWPVPQVSNHFWGSSIFDINKYLFYPLAPLGLGLVAFALKDQTRLVVGWLLGAGLILGLGTVMQAGHGPWQYGHLALLFFGLMWLTRSQPTTEPAKDGKPINGRNIFNAFLVSQLLVGVAATTTSLFVPFTAAEAATKWIISHPTSSSRPSCVMGDPENMITDIAGRLHKPIYAVSANVYATFDTWSDPDYGTGLQTAPLAAAAAKRMDCAPTLVALFDLPNATDNGWTLVAQFPAGLRSDEQYWIYRPAST